MSRNSPITLRSLLVRLALLFVTALGRPNRQSQVNQNAYDDGSRVLSQREWAAVYMPDLAKKSHVTERERSALERGYRDYLDFQAVKPLAQPPPRARTRT